ncbi:MAG: hypothetical protein ACLFUG_04740, partial [Nitriliruptoraceae bacterium]
SAGVHADPGRRSGGRRVRRLSAHLPSVPALLDAHAGAAVVAVALSPGVDPLDPELPAGVEVTFVQVAGRLLEATVWAGRQARAAVTRTGAVLLDTDGAEVARLPAAAHPGAPTAGPVSEELPVGEIGAWLVEVAPAAVRARRHDELGSSIGARRIARSRALLTTDSPPPSSPWYHAREVLAVLPARPKAVRRWLDTALAHDHLDGGVEVVLHGIEADVDELLRSFGRPRTGPHGLRIELVRLDRGSVAVVTAAAGPPAGGRLAP